VARKKKKSGITIKDPESLAVLGVVCLIIAALLALSLFVESDVLNIFRRYFGWGVSVMSVVLLVTAIRLFGTTNKYNSTKVVFFLVLFNFCFQGWIQLFAQVDKSRIIAEQGGLGGIIGYNISEYAKERLAIEGAFVVLGILMLVALLTALEVSPKQIGEGINFVFELVTSFFGFLKRMFIGIGSAAKSGKSKIDNLEMNIVTKGGKGKGNSEDGEELAEMDPNALSIKMVSDISGKKEMPARTEAPVINTKPSAPAPDAPLKNFAPKNPDRDNPNQEVDLSVRKYPDWQLPTIEILDPLKPKESNSDAFIKRNAKAIEETLRSFNIEAKIAGYTQGPTVTQYFVDPKAGVKFSKIANLSKDLALTLASPADLRIELVPNTSFIGIDVPNEKRQMTQFRESIKPIYDEGDKFTLGMAVGIDTAGKPVARDLSKMPHLLVAGATGMGKSVLVNAFITSLLMQKSPDELKFIMIDPKMVEMAPYDGIPHLLTSPITDMSKAATALKWAVNEMEERYKLLKEARARNIEGYVAETGSLMPYIVIVIDEFSDLMMQYRAEVEASIIRLAQKSRAVGIHLIIATQRPTANVITGLIKSNVPARVALTVASNMDSRVVLDSTGAETLLGKGDLLFKTANDLKPVRIQGLWMPDSEFNRIIEFIKDQAPDVQYNEDQILTTPSEAGGDGEGGDFLSDDPLFKQAAEIVISAQKGSASLLQTKMKIGYARAARLVDELEMAGIVGPQDGPRPREVLVTDMDAFFNGQSTEGTGDE
jgi:DNA segregation ATPase FtsK/SpoIIIE, S-DNA-T family